MANNLIIPFAQGAGANVLTDAAYAASDVIAQGFQAGRAASIKYNKAMRQSTSVASGFGQFTADFSAVDFTDSLSPQAMRDNFRVALAAALDGARMGVDTGTAPNQITFPLTPLPPTLSGNRIIWFRPGATNTGATTVTILKGDGTTAYGPLPVKRRGGLDPVAGDLTAGYWYGATCDGATLTLLALTVGDITGIATSQSGRAAANARVNTNTGNGTVTIAGSTNISSITKGTVTYSGQTMNTITVNFVTPMSTANYAVIISAGLDSSGSGALAHLYGTPTTTSFTILMLGQSSGVYPDQQTNLSFVVFQNP